ncbi:hypothetical protein PRJBM_01372 [Bartonella henselae]|nr:hypothetical protein Q654_01384 [Bartonella henselae JK 50]ETS07470.1 hypothetical protein Q655_01335 [Bartonella henselae JK 51]ETS11475.1 hypothetical protein Q653_00406 [Bartonella henselae JK 42]ETS15481.1 hypothetical protein Q652_00539 [Bartonella henselae JK 41]KEC59928.1 hypothetical protein O95_00445 [Bartonella henselae JK 53]KEC60418.1 hypothetical protein O97_00018 [Bartonella henselae str. Zeus]OLL54213.1 hypothetical protein AT238_05810 [Bartonella henselae]PNM38932.1 hypoth
MLFFTFFDGVTPLIHVKQNAIFLPIHILFLKKHFSMLASIFRDAVREWYSDKAIVHQPLYVYEKANQHHHSLC